jgi:hypothetical protein
MVPRQHFRMLDEAFKHLLKSKSLKAVMLLPQLRRALGARRWHEFEAQLFSEGIIATLLLHAKYRFLPVLNMLRTAKLAQQDVKDALFAVADSIPPKAQPLFETLVLATSFGGLRMLPLKFVLSNCNTKLKSITDPRALTHVPTVTTPTGARNVDVVLCLGDKTKFTVTHVLLKSATAGSATTAVTHAAFYVADSSRAIVPSGVSFAALKRQLAAERDPEEKSFMDIATRKAAPGTAKKKPVARLIGAIDLRLTNDCFQLGEDHLPAAVDTRYLFVRLNPSDDVASSELKTTSKADAAAAAAGLDLNCVVAGGYMTRDAALRASSKPLSDIVPDTDRCNLSQLSLAFGLR